MLLLSETRYLHVVTETTFQVWEYLGLGGLFLLSLLVEKPVLISSTTHFRIDQTDPQRIRPMFLRLHLAVFSISGVKTKQWDFLKALPRYSFQHSALPQEKHTNQPGDTGVTGVIKGRVILFSEPLADILLYLNEYFNGGAAYRLLYFPPLVYERVDSFASGLEARKERPFFVRLYVGASTGLVPVGDTR